MPKETLTFSLEKYPDMKRVRPGSEVKVMASGKVSNNDGQSVSIETDNVEISANAAQQEMHDLMGHSDVESDQGGDDSEDY